MMLMGDLRLRSVTHAKAIRTAKLTALRRDTEAHDKKSTRRRGQEEEQNINTVRR